MKVKTVQRQSIISFIWQIAFTLIGFISTMYFAHAVGANVMGAYFLFVSYLSIISMVTDGGFGGAAIKRISEGEEKDAYFSAFVVLRSLFVTVIMVALIVFRKYFVDLNSAGTFEWLLLALFVSVIGGSISSGIAGSGKMGIHATGTFINNVSTIFIQIIAIYLGYSLVGLVGGAVIGTLIGAIVELRFLDLHFVRFSWRHIKNLSAFSFWIFLISTGSIVFTNADTVMIGYFLDNSNVGVYRVLLQFTVVAAFIATALRGTLYPKVSRWGKIGKNGLIEESLSRAFTYSLTLAVPLFAGGILLGDRLIYFFYGQEFVNYETFIILFAVQIVNIIQNLFTIYLIALDRLKDLFKISALAIAANITLNAVLIPIIGIKGAAIATLVTMTFNAVFTKRLLSKIITVRIERESILNIIKASVVMSVFVGGYRILVPLSSISVTFVPILVSSLVYGILILKFDSKIYEELKGIMYSVYK